MRASSAMRRGSHVTLLFVLLLAALPTWAEHLLYPTPEAILQGREITNVIEQRAQYLMGRDGHFNHQNARIFAEIDTRLVDTDFAKFKAQKQLADVRGQQLAWDADDTMMSYGRGAEAARAGELGKIQELAYQEALAEYEADLAARRTTTLSGKAGQTATVGAVPDRFDPKLTGTSPELTKGAMTDRDHATMQRKRVDSLSKAARKLGYTVRVGEGGSVTIVELDSTYFWKNPNGIDSVSSIMDAEVMVNKGVIPSATDKGPIASRMRAMNIYDNLKKSHGTLPTENFEKLLQPAKTPNERLQQWEKIHDMAKATKRMQLTMSTAGKPDWETIQLKAQRALEAGKRARFTFNEQLEILKQGYSPEAAGIVDTTDPPDVQKRKMLDFHAECGKVADKATRFAVKENQKWLDGAVQEYRHLAEIDPAKAGALKSEIMRQVGVTRAQKLAVIKHSGLETLAEMEGITATNGWVDSRSGNPLTEQRIDKLKSSGKWDGYPKEQRRIFVDAQGEKLTASRVQSRLLGSESKTLAQLDKLRAPQGIDAVVARTKRVAAKTADFAKRATKAAISKVYDGPYVDTGGPLSQKSAFSMDAKVGTLMAVNIYHSWNRAKERVEQGVTADDSDLSLYGKVFGQTLWYTSGLGWVEDVARKDYGNAMDEYRKARAEGKDPSLAMAVAKGTLDSANTLVTGAVKGVTVQPVVNGWNLLYGYYDAIGSSLDMVAAGEREREMEGRMQALKNEIARKSGVAERQFAKMEDRFREVQKLDPVDESKLTLRRDSNEPESEAMQLALDVQYGQRLSAELEAAKAEYRAEIDASPGDADHAGNAALKRLDRARQALEAFNADPTAVRKRAQVQANIAWYKRQIAHSDRVRAALKAGKPLPPPLAACDEAVKEPLRWIRLSTEGMRRNKEGMEKEIAAWQTEIQRETDEMHKDDKTHAERLAAMRAETERWTDEKDRRAHQENVDNYAAKIASGTVRPHPMGHSRLEHQKRIRDDQAAIADIQKRYAEGNYDWHPMAETDREHMRMLRWAQQEYAKWTSACVD